LNTKILAEDYIRRAMRYLREAENAFSEGDFASTIRRSQECIELSVKSVLRAVGIEFPREHDVSEVLLELDVDMPEWFRDKIHRIAGIMREITPKRGISMYGLERELKPASDIFSEEDARVELKNASEVHFDCDGFVRWWFKDEL
jgi:HEPN domain-containing protein